MDYLLGKKQATPELPAAYHLPIFVNPALTFLEIAGDLLKGHYLRLVIRFNTG